MEGALTYPAWASVAFREMLHGVREVAGAKHNPRILEYQRSTNLRAMDDETPWCSAFVCWCLEECRIRGTGLANARSYLDWGTRCDGRLGGIAVLWRGRPDGWQGHVGFLVGEEHGRLLILGGNQGDRVSVKTFPAARLLGYRWPRPEDWMTSEVRAA